MSGQTFSESGLSFQFPKEWIVFKYDEHRFYTYLSGEGLKGVDFIAIHEETLLLIEVKNYADRIIKEDFDPMEGLISEPALYISDYLRKFQDTFRLLDIIEQYYNRKWWYRNIFQRFKSFFYKRRKIKSETEFWSKAIDILDKMEAVKLVLWLELAPQYEVEAAEKLYAHFQKKLEAKIPEGAELIIAHSRRPLTGVIMKKEKV